MQVLSEISSKINGLAVENKDVESLIKELSKIKTENVSLKRDKQKIISEKNLLQQEKNNLQKTINKLSSDITRQNFTYSIRSCCKHSACLDCKGLEYGNSCYLWDFCSNENQLYNIIKNEDNSFSIKNRASGYFLGIEFVGIGFRINFRRKGENDQKFRIRRFNDDY